MKRIPLNESTCLVAPAISESTQLEIQNFIDELIGEAFRQSAQEPVRELSPEEMAVEAEEEAILNETRNRLGPEKFAIINSLLIKRISKYKSVKQKEKNSRIPETFQVYTSSLLSDANFRPEILDTTVGNLRSEAEIQKPLEIDRVESLAKTLVSQIEDLIDRSPVLVEHLLPSLGRLMQRVEDSPFILRRKEVAERYQVSPARINALQVNGRLRGVHFLSETLYTNTAVEEARQNQRPPGRPRRG